MVGYGNYLNLDGVDTITSPVTNSICRLVSFARVSNQVIDLTAGRRCRTVFVSTGKYILSSRKLEDIIDVNRDSKELLALAGLSEM